MKKRVITLTTALFSTLLLNMGTAAMHSEHVSLELEKESADLSLAIEGEIPSWLCGTLVRNGPVIATVDGKTNEHWFDGLAMLHAFSFHGGSVKYSNRFLRTDAYRTVFEEGTLNYGGFASDPCRSIFKRFFTMLFSPSTPSLHNANVNVAKIADQYVALTETPLPVRFDRETLETLGVLEFHDDLPQKDCWESAHPHYDPMRKETVNYLIRYGKTSYYVLYRIEDGSSERKVIAEVPVEKPSYMHSFALTENYIVLTEFPFCVNPFDLILSKQPFIKNFDWEPESGTRFTVVNRSNGQITGRFKTDPFFAFHHVAAFEKQDQLLIDIICYADAKVVTGIAGHFKNEPGSDPVEETHLGPQSLKRFTLSLKTGELACDLILQKPIELPRINEIYDGHPYRYAYLTDPRDKEGSEDIRPLYKVDTETKQVLSWEQKGCYPGEPVFVAKPDSRDEDDGVVMTVIIDLLNNSSFLLILDGKTFKEIGRANAPYRIPAGLHGKFFD